MSARKRRPPAGADIEPGMSLRDISSCIGVSKSELLRWKQLAALPEQVFESRLAARRAEMDIGKVKTITASMLLVDAAACVPARGRVERALALVRGMTDSERRQFLVAWGRTP